MFSKKQEVVTSGNGQVDTFLSTGTKFEGTMNATGTLRIDGEYGGEIITQGNLIVGENGKLTADVNANHVTLAGYLKGNVYCSGTLEITDSGKLYGGIDVKHLIIHEGAVFQGNCKMKDEENQKQNVKDINKAKQAKSS